MTKDKKIIGKEEWCALPELGLPGIKSRVDTGAKTSALHAFNIFTFEENGKLYVSFDVHPLQHDRRISRNCKAEVIDNRIVKSTSGRKENRLVIKTPVKVGDLTWDIEVTLTNRDSMGYRMLLGREAMEKRFLIDPEHSFYFGDLSHKEVAKLYPERKPKQDGYKILLLASNPELYSNKRIMEAAERRGHSIRFIDIKHCYINISSSSPKILYRGGEVLTDIDAIIPRIKPSISYYGCAVVRHFQMMGVFCLNDAQSISRSRDKLRSLQILAQNKIDTPTTGFAHLPEANEEVISMVGGAPLVVKLLEGTQGKGVVLAETRKAAESVINAFKKLNADILVQEFIKEAQGKDLRCFVVNGKVVGTIQREAAEGEFRANLHMGGKASKVKITAEEKRIAIRSAKAMGLLVAGVDLIRSKSGPKVLEINSSPGLEGIEKITEKDIADIMIESLEMHLGKAK